MEEVDDAILEIKLGDGNAAEGKIGHGITCRAKNQTSIFVNLLTSVPRLNIPCPETALPSVEHLIQMVASLPKETSRKISALVGAVVADAASLPLQWIYEDMENVGGWRVEGGEVVGGDSPHSTQPGTVSSSQAGIAATRTRWPLVLMCWRGVTGRWMLVVSSNAFKHTLAIKTRRIKKRWSTDLRFLSSTSGEVGRWLRIMPCCPG